MRRLRALAVPLLPLCAVLATVYARVDVGTKALWRRLSRIREARLVGASWRVALAASAHPAICGASGAALDEDNLTGGPADIVVLDLPAAKITTNFGSSPPNDFTVEAIDGGAPGNSYKLHLFKPATDSPLSVSVTGAYPNYIIKATLETLSAAIQSTPMEVVNAINDNDFAQGLVMAYLKAGSVGTGLVEELAATNLSGGSDTGAEYNLGITGAPTRMTPGFTTLDLIGQQTGGAAAPVKRLVRASSVDVEITIAEVNEENLKRAWSTSVLLSDGATKQRLEIRDMPGRDLLKAARRWEIREYENGAPSPDPQKIWVLPKACPGPSTQPVVFDVDGQRVAQFTLNAYRDARGRRAFRGNEDF